MGEKNLENIQGQVIMKNLVSTQGQVIMRNLAIILDQAITKNLVKALALAIGIFLVHLNLPPRKKLLLLQLLPLLPLPQIPAHAIPYEITSEMDLSPLWPNTVKPNSMPLALMFSPTQSLRLSTILISTPV